MFLKTGAGFNPEVLPVFCAETIATRQIDVKNNTIFFMVLFCAAKIKVERRIQTLAIVNFALNYDPLFCCSLSQCIFRNFFLCLVACIGHVSEP
jgi:hypothetical protein